MFERGRKESATPGVGLGLAICRAIVGAHGGTITGDTRAAGGARFGSRGALTSTLAMRSPRIITSRSDTLLVEVSA